MDILLALLMAFCASATTHGQLPPVNPPRDLTCQPVASIPLCSNVGYPAASFPNLRGQQTPDEANAELLDFLPAVLNMCSNAIVHFLCAVYAPACSEAHSDGTTSEAVLRVQPCRNLCEYVREGCEATLVQLGFDWPQCAGFPIPRREDECYGPLDPKLLQIPAGILPNTSHSTLGSSSVALLQESQTQTAPGQLLALTNTGLIICCCQLKGCRVG